MKLSDFSSDSGESQATSFYISLSDLMMLLLVFFVMLLAMSKIDTGSFEVIRSGFTGSTKGTLVELADQLQQIVKGQPGVPGVTVHLAEDGVRLDLDTSALFATGSASLKPGALDPLLPILQVIRSTQYRIDIEGHSDDVPLHRLYKIDDEKNLETNWSLSGRRASSVIQHLLDLGFQSQKLRVIGYADTRPVQPIAGKQGEELNAARAVNRRVSLLIR